MNPPKAASVASGSPMAAGSPVAFVGHPTTERTPELLGLIVQPPDASPGDRIDA
jgi:hypothetical protein